MRLAIAFSLLMTWAVSFAQVTQLVIQFEVKPQPLGDALRSLASQVNANIIYDPSLTRGHDASGFVMRSTLDEALTRVLRGTGLSHQYVNEKTVTLVRIDADLKKALNTTVDGVKVAAPQSAQRIRK